MVYDDIMIIDISNCYAIEFLLLNLRLIYIIFHYHSLVNDNCDLYIWKVSKCMCNFIYCFTAQVLKVCRTPGPTAYSRTIMLHLTAVAKCSTVYCINNRLSLQNVFPKFKILHCITCHDNSK